MKATPDGKAVGMSPGHSHCPSGGVDTMRGPEEEGPRQLQHTPGPEGLPTHLLEF